MVNSGHKPGTKSEGLHDELKANQEHKPGTRCDSPYPESSDGTVQEPSWQRRPNPHDGPIFRHVYGDPCQDLLGKSRRIRRTPAAQHLAFPRSCQQQQPLSCDAGGQQQSSSTPPAGSRHTNQGAQERKEPPPPAGRHTNRGDPEPVYSKFRACLELFAKGFGGTDTTAPRRLGGGNGNQTPAWISRGGEVTSYIPTPTQKLPLSSRLRWEPNYRAEQQQQQRFGVDACDSSSALPASTTSKNTEDKCCQNVVPDRNSPCKHSNNRGGFLPPSTSSKSTEDKCFQSVVPDHSSSYKHGNNRGSFGEWSDRSSDIATSSVSLNKCDSDSEVSSVVSEVSDASSSLLHVPVRYSDGRFSGKQEDGPKRFLNCSSHSLHCVKPLCSIPVLDVIGRQHTAKLALVDTSPRSHGASSGVGGGGGRGDLVTPGRKRMNTDSDTLPASIRSSKATTTSGSSSDGPSSGTGSKPKRRVRPKPDIPAYLNLCRNKSPSPPTTPQRSEHDERACMSDGERCDVENLENLLSLNFTKFRLGKGGVKGVRKTLLSKDKKDERPRYPTFGRSKARNAKVDKLRQLTEKLKPPTPVDDEAKLTQTAMSAEEVAEETTSDGAAGFSPPPLPDDPSKVSFIIGCVDDDPSSKNQPDSPCDDPKEDDIFEEFNLGKLNSSIIVGSYAQRTIPFRSASFSQVDVSSDGKYTRSSKSPIALKPIAFSFNRDGSTLVGSATLPRKKYTDVRGEVASTVNLGEMQRHQQRPETFQTASGSEQEPSSEEPSPEEGMDSPTAVVRRKSLKKEVSFDKEEDMVVELPADDEEEEAEGDKTNSDAASNPEEQVAQTEEKRASSDYDDDTFPKTFEACPASPPNTDSSSSPTMDRPQPEFADAPPSGGVVIPAVRLSLSDREDGSRTSSLDDSVPDSDGGAGTHTEFSDDVPDEPPKTQSDPIPSDIYSPDDCVDNSAKTESELCQIQVESIPEVPPETDDNDDDDEEATVDTTTAPDDWTTAVELIVEEVAPVSHPKGEEWRQSNSDPAVQSEDVPEPKEPRKLRASTSLEEEVSEKHSLSVRPIRCRAHTMSKERSPDHHERIYSGGSELYLLTPRRNGEESESQSDISSSQTRCRTRTVSPSPINFDSDSSINSDRGVPRSPHGPRRYSKRPLRGPYGEMLEAEMSKSELNKIFSKSHLSEELSFLRDLTNMRDTKSSSPRCSSPVSPAVCQGVPADPWLRSAPLHASHSLDDSQLKVGYHSSPSREVPKRKTSANIPYLPSSDGHPTTSQSTLTVSHHRTASSPSQLQIFTEGFTSEDEPELVELMPKARLYDSLPSTNSDNTNNVARSASVKRRRDTRTHVVGELYDTERSYVESLKVLVTKYLQPLKSPENSGLIDAGLVDEIFYQVPAILAHHEVFLEELRQRLESWNTKQKVGDVFLEAFTKQPVIDTYTAFINNWKSAKEAIKVACQAKPAFARFLEAKSREHTGKLALDSLLIMPVQRIPRYELLIKELLKHTEKDLPDHTLLLQAQKQVHDLAVKINCVERETLESEQQLQVLKELESLVEGLVNVVSPERCFLRHDMVTMAAGQGTRKERCLFLFSDLLVITSIKRKSATIRKPSTSCQGSLAGSLEANKYKLLMKIPLDDLEIAKSKDENIKRLLKEVATLEEDVSTLTQIVDLTSALNTPHAPLEEAARDLLSVLHRQLGERQAADSQLTYLELALTTQDGIENMSVVFTSPEKRASWEEAFHEAKQKLVLSADRRPPPEFLHPLPIRKTRAGLQFTCASPTLGLNVHQLRDVWVCNSDGFVGQVCVLSLQPDPTVTSCNGVCNARILAIAPVPPPPNCLDGGTNQRRSAFNDGGKTAISISVEDMDDGGTNIQLDSSSSDDEEETGDDAEEERKRGWDVGNPNDSLSETSSICDIETTATMWLGTEDGNIHVYNCGDNIRIKKNKIRMQHNAPVQGIIYLDNKVFVALANGQVMVYCRDSGGVWNTADPHILTISSSSLPVARMLAIAGKLWCSYQNIIKIIDTNTLEIEHTFPAHPESHRIVTSMVSSGLGVWLATQNSASVRLFHVTSYELLGEVNVTPAVTKMLAGCDDIIRQHKAACLRITALLASKDLLWVGTSAGVVLNLPVPHLTSTTSKLTSTPNVTGIPHGHTGHVRFLTCVEMSPAEPRNPRTKSLTHRYSLKNKEMLSHPNVATGSAKLLVISGGDGYEDFRNSSVSEVAGREDSTNHLLLWQV